MVMLLSLHAGVSEAKPSRISGIYNILEYKPKQSSYRRGRVPGTRYREYHAKAVFVVQDASLKHNRGKKYGLTLEISVMHLGRRKILKRLAATLFRLNDPLKRIIAEVMFRRDLQSFAIVSGLLAAKVSPRTPGMIIFNRNGGFGLVAPSLYQVFTSFLATMNRVLGLKISDLPTLTRKGQGLLLTLYKYRNRHTVLNRLSYNLVYDHVRKTSCLAVYSVRKRRMFYLCRKNEVKLGLAWLKHLGVPSVSY